MVREGALIAQTGETVPVQADTLCVHGDKPQAVEFAQAIGAALKAKVGWRWWHLLGPKLSR